MVIVPLKELYYHDNEDSKNKLLESFKLFECNRSSKDVMSFLKEKCVQFEDNHLSRTYLAIDEKSFELLGYFAIAMKSIEIGGETQKVKRKFTGMTKTNHSPAFLLGQIAKSKNSNGKLEKYQLLNEAISYVKKAQEIVGGRIIYLDCVDELVAYYENFGFKKLRKHDGYNQMFLTL